MNRPTQALQWLEVVEELQRLGNACEKACMPETSARQILAYIRELEDKAWRYDELQH